MTGADPGSDRSARTKSRSGESTSRRGAQAYGPGSTARRSCSPRHRGLSAGPRRSRARRLEGRRGGCGGSGRRFVRRAHRGRGARWTTRVAQPRRGTGPRAGRRRTTGQGSPESRDAQDPGRHMCAPGPYAFSNSSFSPDACSTSRCRLLPWASIVTMAGKSSTVEVPHRLGHAELQQRHAVHLLDAVARRTARRRRWR